MIIIKLFVCVIIYKKYSISLDPLELHCNFSKHLFNYFKYSEKYLYNFENNIPESELKDYGTAVKSHGEIVMIMLDSLREMDEEYIAADLMTVNLYLNNVSGSINIIAKNENGEFSRSERSQNLLEGYKILHRSIVERLEYFLNGKCFNISVKNDFIYLTNFQEPIKHSLEVLRNEIEKLNNKIIKIMKEYLTFRDMFVGTDNKILKRYCKIISHLATAFERKLYHIYNPSNVLFYDLLENRPCFLERDLASGSQVKQYIRYNSDNQQDDVLDMVRYAPLLIKGSDNYEIKLFDVFRFVKFDFNLENVQTFINLVNSATVRPIMLIVRFYFSLVRKFLYLPKFRNIKLKNDMKYKIIDLGQNIVENMKSFMDLNLFEEEYRTKIEYGFNKMYALISSFKDHNDLFASRETQSISKYHYSFLRNNFLKSYFSKLQKANVTEDNINEIHDFAVQEVNKITLFVSELKKYQYCFEIAKKFPQKSYVGWRLTRKNIKHNIPFGQLGNHDDIYRTIDFPRVNTNDIKIHYSPSPSDEDNEMDNDDNNNFDVATQKYYNPKYLVDYLLIQ
ncbi:uncharacterized protein LOC126907514 isoform X3 [Daktulosphaira vitifoliae]|uniref:uncharacterized protein LOC126907514 isoform X3 n=1 Tax=Daktulosphaira vitifoliae TaxID=58002 RepID=UPI0021AA25BC|nr:uncharacterized protein LOC126907514 isoform X3 [Daktulosphaira vitifoliae]